MECCKQLHRLLVLLFWGLVAGCLRHWELEQVRFNVGLIHCGQVIAVPVLGGTEGGFVL